MSPREGMKTANNSCGRLLELSIEHRLVIVPTHGSVIPKILKDRLTSGFGEGFFVKRTRDDFATLVKIGVVGGVG
jgi:hypothetical protein